jgi:hypothetical protein
MTSNRRPLSVGQAILAGHLVVNGPTVLVLVGGGYLGQMLADSFGLGALVAALPAWLWWSFVIPRWRQWALTTGADPERLERLGVRTLLLWPKGSLFARTELPPRDRR